MQYITQDSNIGDGRFCYGVAARTPPGKIIAKINPAVTGSGGIFSGHFSGGGGSSDHPV